MIPHEEHMLPLSCPWCGAAFMYSWWCGGQKCKHCGHPTGKAEVNRGNVNEVFYKVHGGSFPDCYDIGPPVDGFVPQFHHTGWKFRCDVVSGQLLAFLKWGAMLCNLNPMTVMSMEYRNNPGVPPARWHWVVSIKIPLGKRPVEMPGVEWHNEMTVRPQ